MRGKKQAFPFNEEPVFIKIVQGTDIQYSINQNTNE
jgi:hypothetical protein